ncbi:MAG: EcsC family protein [Fibrobacter sp.]|nr:EcsC family protein [Fibrobacter sp.]
MNDFEEQTQTNEFKNTKNNCVDKLKDQVSSLLFELITDIPESLHEMKGDPEKKVKALIDKASRKAALYSATLSIPAGFTGILASIPDIAAVWRIQAQLVSDIAATYGKFALLSREAMVWCLFRHSAAQLLRDIAVRTSSRIVIQKVSTTALQKILQKIGLQISTKLVGKIALRLIPAIGVVGNGAYTYYDTREVGKTADAYFKNLQTKDANEHPPKVKEDKE